MVRSQFEHFLTESALRLSTAVLPLALLSALLLSGCTSTSDNSDGCGKGTPAQCSASPKPSGSASPTKLPPPPSRLPSIAPHNDTVKADLTNLKSALQKYSADHSGSFPKKMDDALATYMPGVSKGTIITGYEVATDVTPNAFCLTGTSTGGTLYTITSNTVVTGGGLCPADHKQW